MDSSFELFNVYIETGRREKFMVCKNLNIEKVVGFDLCEILLFHNLNIFQTRNNCLCHI